MLTTDYLFVQLILLDFSIETRPVRSPISAKTGVQNQLVIFIYEGADLDLEFIVFLKAARRKKKQNQNKTHLVHLNIREKIKIKVQAHIKI